MPEHWEVKRLKFLASINDESLSETEDPLRPIQYVDIGSVDYLAGIIQTKETVFEDAPSRARRLVRHGDTVISTVGTSLRAVAHINNPSSEMVVSTGFAVVRPRDMDSNFATWALREHGFVREIVARSVGVIYPAINASEIGNLLIPVPPLEEQRVIAEFLDRETARVDALVEKKQQLIERLAEYRTALITQTVTKGLPPDVAAAEGFNPAPSLKPSGVEWLGDVPEHWEVKRAKYASKIIMGQSPPSDAYNDEQVEQAFLQGNAEFGALHPKPKWYCDAAIKVVAAGTILLSVRAPVGELNVADKNYGIGRGLCGLQTISKYLNRQFAWWALHTARQELEHQAVGSTYDAVSVAEVACLSLPLPPLSEQRAIAEFLDRETERIDALSARVETAIERLQEYRTALITAAVTGKIDVRGFVGVETADIGTVAK
ncbi:MAG: restriction endonuclease subunit S [bacterium]|nr:restriction endonuclease subunit S [bacterium]